MDDYTSASERLDNVQKAELGFATKILQAERWGCAVRDPGVNHPIEMIVFSPEYGQWALVPIEPKRALSLAEDLINYALRRL